MHFSRDVSIGDIGSMLLLLTAVVALFFTWQQLKDNNQKQRAIFFKDLYSTFFFDPDISYAFYVIEGGEVDFTGYYRSGEEKQFNKIDAINKLLAQCELISALYLRGAISEDEMTHFEYNLIRTSENPNIQKYFRQIDTWNEAHGFKMGPFSKFRSLGAKLSQRHRAEIVNEMSDEMKR